MRCQFCGWENPETKKTCEKCNHPLLQETSLGKSTVREANVPVEGTERHTRMEESFNPKATIREESGREEPAVCPACGYAIEGEKICPSCGAEVTTTGRPGSVGDFKKTIRPNHNHRFNQEKFNGFRLVKLSESGQPLGSVQFDSVEVALNRDNTDSLNQTITSQIQAIVKKEGNKWVISDQSELRSTFVHATRPIELQNGDLVLLGDQLFRFEAN